MGVCLFARTPCRKRAEGTNSGILYGAGQEPAIGAQQAGAGPSGARVGPSRRGGFPLGFVGLGSRWFFWHPPLSQPRAVWGSLGFRALHPRTAWGEASSTLQQGGPSSNSFQIFIWARPNYLPCLGAGRIGQGPPSRGTVDNEAGGKQRSAFVFFFDFFVARVPRFFLSEKTLYFLVARPIGSGLSRENHRTRFAKGWPL